MPAVALKRIKFWIFMLAFIAASFIPTSLGQLPQAFADTGSNTDGVWSPESGLVLVGTVVTMNDNDDVLFNGQVVIKGHQIVAVLEDGEALPEGFEETPVIETGGVIFPGLINAHSHIAYNVLPLYEAPSAYKNRYQWTKPKKYKADVNGPKKILTASRFLGIQDEVIKYAEIKALVGGTTAIQGGPTGSKAFKDLLVRNIDYGLDIDGNGLTGKEDNIYQHGLAITDQRFAKEVQAGGGILAKMKSGKAQAFLCHIAEGIDEKSRAEFDFIRDELNILRDETVIIHGTALGKSEFKQMAKAGVDLVWSPLSNLLLYGETTDIPTAVSAGVNVSLAPDWAPSGSKNLLGELKVAYQINSKEWNRRFSFKDLVKMVTVNPAKAIGWDGHAGRIQEGFLADIMVIDPKGKNPYAALVKGTDRNVQLVMVGGDPLYGDDEHMDFLKGEDCEVIYDNGGREKKIDVTKEDTVKGEQTVEEIVDIIDEAMANLDPSNPDAVDWLKERFKDGDTMNDEEFDAFLKKKFPGLHPIELDPMFAEEDPSFFEKVAASETADFPYNLAGFYGLKITKPESPGFTDAIGGAAGSKEDN